MRGKILHEHCHRRITRGVVLVCKVWLHLYKLCQFCQLPSLEAHGLDGLNFIKTPQVVFLLLAIYLK